jgi:hypothetical protein
MLLFHGKNCSHNPQGINELQLITSRFGIDSLSEVQKTELAFIAHLCPFAAGPAVYSARVLYSALNPMAQYYDRLTCVQNLGQNKNQETGYYNIDSLYETDGEKLGAELIATNNQYNNSNSLIKEENSNYPINEMIKIYPNPASTTVIIAYNKEFDGIFTLFNMLGEIILQTTLSYQNSKTQIPIQDIANGVYHYEIQFGTEGKINGILNILK